MGAYMRTAILYNRLISRSNTSNCDFRKSIFHVIVFCLCLGTKLGHYSQIIFSRTVTVPQNLRKYLTMK